MVDLIKRLGYVKEEKLNREIHLREMAEHKLSLMETALGEERAVNKERLINVLHSSTKTRIEITGKDDYIAFSDDPSHVGMRREIRREPLPHQGYELRTVFNINSFRAIYGDMDKMEIHYIIEMYLDDLRRRIDLLMRVKLGEF